MDHRLCLSFDVREVYCNSNCECIFTLPALWPTNNSNNTNKTDTIHTRWCFHVYFSTWCVVVWVLAVLFLWFFFCEFRFSCFGRATDAILFLVVFTCAYINFSVLISQSFHSIVFIACSITQFFSPLFFIFYLFIYFARIFVLRKYRTKKYLRNLDLYIKTLSLILVVKQAFYST